MPPIIDDLTNLPMLASDQIRAYIVDVDAALSSLRKELESRKDKEIASLRENIAKQAAELGIDPHELIASPDPITPAKQRRAPGIPKYRNPGDPGQTWTGRGKRPTWLVQLVEAGTPLESLLINPSA